ncbi:enoyl-CoA hydratase/isomerase [Pseudomonas aeruginosa VRFPA02]|nr:enoyl-CoA hydratase/isomerase [Pseudomonas aeruginosa VRFPA02]
MQTRVEAGIAWLVLNRPQQRNALDIPTLEALHVRLDACERDPAVRAVVLGGSGRSFCAGADLAEWAAAEARGELESYGWTEAAHALMGRLHALDKPTVAAVNGSAVGAGMDLALCCDFRIAAASARFKAGYTGMAYCPDAGASWHLPRLLGSEAAKRLLFLDEAWSAERALGAGLVGEVVADERLVETVGAFAARLASGPTFAFAQTKRLLRDGAGRSLVPSRPPGCSAGAARMPPRRCAPWPRNVPLNSAGARRRAGDSHGFQADPGTGHAGRGGAQLRREGTAAPRGRCRPRRRGVAGAGRTDSRQGPRRRFLCLQHARGSGWRRPRLPVPGAGRTRAVEGLLGPPRIRRAALEDPHGLHRRTARRLPVALRAGRKDRLLRPHRAGRRLRRQFDQDPRGARRRRLRDQR